MSGVMWGASDNERVGNLVDDDTLVIQFEDVYGNQYENTLRLGSDDFQAGDASYFPGLAGGPVWEDKNNGS